MGKTVLQRLAAIDLRLAQRISRNKIGNLIGRLYFTKTGASGGAEVPILMFQDQGLGGADGATGQDERHSYLVHIGRAWWDANHKRQGQYSVVPNEAVSRVRRNVRAVSEAVDDGTTYAAVVFAEELEVKTF